jgi:DDE family transposase
MRVSHKVTAVFDDPNLISVAGLAPVMALAERAGLHELVAEHVTVPGSAGANAVVKVPALVAGMVAGADSISDLDLLRHGGMGRLFDAIRAPTTVGTFLRAVSFGHVRQFDAVASRLLLGLARQTPVLAGAGEVTYLDVDDTIRETHGYAKQGAGYGYSGVKGLNALVGTLSTPLSPPVIAATRLRKGATNSAKGAFRLIGDALAIARAAGAGTAAGGMITVRADSAFYNHRVVAAARRGGARFSVTARMDPAVRRAIASIDEDAWTPIRYPDAIWEEAEQRWISDAEVAEIEFTAFTSRRKAEHVSARLIIRRVKRLNPASVPAGQTALFAQYRHHAVFTDSPLPMLDAESAHRDHAIVEQVIAELKAGPLAHLPSGRFTANAAWLVCAAMAFNLTRAAGALASTFHAKARTATIRAQLINIPARIASSARRLRLHLPRNWPWQTGYDQLFTATLAPPGTVAA